MSPIPTTPNPNTPGTPKSPLPSTVTTPTKTRVPDTIKTSPGSVCHILFYFFLFILSRTYVLIHLCNFKSTLVCCFCSLLYAQCSSCVPSIVAPAGNYFAHKSGLSTSFTASYIPRSSYSESPDGRFSSTSTSRSCSAWPGVIGRKSASHTGTSDPSPDPDASVSVC